jgi:hypothetical protein
MSDVPTLKDVSLSTPIPLWLGGVIGVAAALLGLVAGGLGNDSDGTGLGPRRTGVVTIVDSQSVCLSEPNGEDNECYRAPGLNLHEGDRVRYALQEIPIDPDDLGKGDQIVLVWAEVED